MITLDRSLIQYVTIHDCDESGRMFKWNGRIFRRIKKDNEKKVLKLINCGLLSELEKEHLFVNTCQPTDVKMNDGTLIIEHKKINTVSYPFEWTFDMLKDVAILVLRINAIALKYGYELSDPHAYNVLFNGCKPIYVDFGSLVEIKYDSINWRGKKEFTRSYLYPLILWSTKRKKPTVASRIVGITRGEIPNLELYHLVYPFVPQVVGKLLEVMQKVMNKIFKVYAKANYKNAKKIVLRKFNREYYYFINKLLTLKDKDQQRWSSYQNEYIDENGEILVNNRFRRIIDIMKEEFHVHNSLELAGNSGVFSELLLKEKIVEFATVTDYDRGAINDCYVRCKHKKEIKNELLPAVLDIIDCAELGMNTRGERFKSDVVIALAVTHHLILSQKFDVKFLVDTFESYTNKFLLVEFMPFGLWSEVEAKNNLPKWYNLQWFKDELRKKFFIIRQETVDENRILLVCKLIKTE